MPIQKVTLAQLADGQTPEEATAVDFITDTATLPFRAISGSTENFIDERSAALQGVCWAAGGFLVGEGMGHKRASEGKEAILPFMR